MIRLVELGQRKDSSFDNSSVYKRAGQQTISSVKTGELSAVYSDELARVYSSPLSNWFPLSNWRFSRE
jgi:hypothetical protein